jgi:predicted acetyltransferase
MPTTASSTGVYSQAEFDAIGRLMSDAFNFPLERYGDYLRSAGHENIRVVQRGNRIAGTMISLPCGQYFGGRAVPMAGIAAVAVAPEHRSSGAATEMLRRELQRLHETGCPLSALYPATVPVYRRAGYELAGASFELRLPAQAIDVRERGLTLRCATSDDASGVARVYRDFAVHTNGNIERTPFFWSRVHAWRGEPAQGYVVECDGRIDGYVFYLKKPGRPGCYTLQLTDIAARTAAAGRRILAFLADHRSQADEVFWSGSPADPLVLLLGEAPLKPRVRDYWMLRLVDVRRALELRGYAPAARGELHLDVADDVLPQNAGRLTLTVEDGRAAVGSGGRGELRADVRGLAALYSSHLTPEELRRCGRLDGPEPALATAAALFAGPAPWMRDGF